MAMVRTTKAMAVVTAVLEMGAAGGWSTTGRTSNGCDDGGVEDNSGNGGGAGGDSGVGDEDAK